MAKLNYLGKNAVVSLTPTNFPVGVPDFDEGGIEKIFILSAVSTNPTVDQIVDPYNPTDWADVTKPAVADHIMLGVNAGIKTWKAKDALVNGDMLMARVRPKSEVVKTS